MSERMLHDVNNRTGPVTGQMSIQDLMGIYGFLNNIANPTEKISQAKDNLETIILEFSRSLTGHPPR